MRAQARYEISMVTSHIRQHYSSLLDRSMISQDQCSGSGMVYPGSRIRIRPLLHPGSGSRIPDPGGKKAPDPGSRILMYIIIGMKNKTNFFLAFYSFRSKFYL
jgi:hypothetical protein